MARDAEPRVPTAGWPQGGAMLAVYDQPHDRSDFTLGPREDEGIRVSEPTVCTEVDGHEINVRRRGHRIAVAGAELACPL